MIWAAIAQAAGSAISAYSSYKTGQAEQALGERNATMKRREAKDVEARGRSSAGRISEEVGSILSGQQSAFAGGNIALDSAIVQDISADTARIGQLDVLTTLGNAARQAYGLRVGADMDIYQGRLANWSGKMQAIGGLLKGAGQAAATYGGGGGS